MAEAWPSVPGLSRATDHIEIMPTPLARAKSSTAWASATVNTSLTTSLTPIIGVTPICLHASACPYSANTGASWAWVLVAACTA